MGVLSISNKNAISLVQGGANLWQCVGRKNSCKIFPKWPVILLVHSFNPGGFFIACFIGTLYWYNFLKETPLNSRMEGGREEPSVFAAPFLFLTIPPGKRITKCGNNCVLRQGKRRMLHCCVHHKKHFCHFIASVHTLFAPTSL